MQRTAVISDDGRYRYQLTRSWEQGDGTLGWIMLNPSTADADLDDPTIRRCISFAKRLGFSGLVVRNLYALRSTDPRGLVNADDPIGPDNRAQLESINEPTIAAWGAHPAAVGWWNGYPYGWQKTVFASLPLWCLGTTKDGSPRHPLYVASDAPIESWVLTAKDPAI